MMRKIFIALAICASAAAYAESAESTKLDTLLSTSNARSIYIQSDLNLTSVTVNSVGGTGENFFYETGISSHASAQEKSILSYSNISNILVAESGAESLVIKFTTARNEEVSFSFSLPDPDNRFVKTYIGAKSSEFGIPIKRASKTSWDLITGGIGLGWVTPVSDEPNMDASMWKSNELTWAIVLGVRMTHGPSSLTFGLGIDWRNYVTKGDRYFDLGDDGKISLMPYEPDSHKHRSRIKTFSLQVPLLYGISFGHRRNCSFILGPVLNFNTGGSIKTQYAIGNKKYSVKTGNINQRPVTVDAMAEFKYKSVGVYVRYSPMEVLKSGTGLDFKSFSTGIMIGI